MQIRRAEERDIPALLEIYNEQVTNSPATFDLAPQSLEERTRWFEAHGADHPICVAEAEGQVVGYASLSKFREKPGYSKTAESSVYVRHGWRGKGVGREAMEWVLQRAREIGYHVVVAGVVPPNEASVRLHEQLGFVHVGDLREVGFKFGKWLDVSFYELRL